MRTPRKATAAVLAGGVALASVAYALGSESGDGSAVADTVPAQRGPDRLADELGVDSAELQKALRDFHEQHASDRRDEFTAALATALGKSSEDVKAALDGRHDRFARRLAEELGIDQAKVRSALTDLRDDPPHGPFGFAAALAGELGVDAAAVEEALRALRPERPLHRHHGREPLRELANALDVTRAELRKALRELRSDLESTMKDRRAELVEFLAERFGLSEDEVEDALPEFGRRTGWTRRTDCAGLARRTGWTGLARRTDCAGLARRTGCAGLARRTGWAGPTGRTGLARRTYLAQRLRRTRSPCRGRALGRGRAQPPPTASTSGCTRGLIGRLSTM